MKSIPQRTNKETHNGTIVPVVSLPSSASSSSLAFALTDNVMGTKTHTRRRLINISSRNHHSNPVGIDPVVNTGLPDSKATFL